MSSSDWIIIPTRKGKITHVPNHQPVYIIIFPLLLVYSLLTTINQPEQGLENFPNKSVRLRGISPTQWLGMMSRRVESHCPSLIKTGPLHCLGTLKKNSSLQTWLVVLTISKNMSSSVGITIPNIWKKHVPNQQPETMEAHCTYTKKNTPDIHLTHTSQMSQGMYV